MKYIEIMDDLTAYLIKVVNYEGLTFGRYEPQPADYPLVKIEFPEKTDEVGRYPVGGDYHYHADLNVPITVCTNEKSIELSRERAWEIMPYIEEAIRDDISLEGIDGVSRAVPRDLRGEDHEGKEYRLMLTLDVRFQIHREVS